MVLHHPWSKDPGELLQNYIDWIAAYQSECLDKEDHNHVDSLPKTVEANDEESDSESIPDADRDVDDWRAEWMDEAARRPNEVIQVDFGNLSKRDIDTLYGWVENSPSQQQVNDASKWLTDCIKESPNDDVQELPETDYHMLKGTQQKVFLQVMTYFHKLKSNPFDKPSPLHINVDGTAGTGKSFLIWCISTAL
jgi:hypothetical protein